MLVFLSQIRSNLKMQTFSETSIKLCSKKWSFSLNYIGFLLWNSFQFNFFFIDIIHENGVFIKAWSSSGPGHYHIVLETPVLIWVRPPWLIFWFDSINPISKILISYWLWFEFMFVNMHWYSDKKYLKLALLYQIMSHNRYISSSETAEG